MTFGNSVAEKCYLCTLKSPKAVGICNKQWPFYVDIWLHCAALSYFLIEKESNEEHFYSSLSYHDHIAGAAAGVGVGRSVFDRYLHHAVGAFVRTLDEGGRQELGHLFHPGSRAAFVQLAQNAGGEAPGLRRRSADRAARQASISMLRA